MNDLKDVVDETANKIERLERACRLAYTYLGDPDNPKPPWESTIRLLPAMKLIELREALREALE